MTEPADSGGCKSVALQTMFSFNNITPEEKLLITLD